MGIHSMNSKHSVMADVVIMLLCHRIATVEIFGFFTFSTFPGDESYSSLFALCSSCPRLCSHLTPFLHYLQCHYQSCHPHCISDDANANVENVFAFMSTLRFALLLTQC